MIPGTFKSGERCLQQGKASKSFQSEKIEMSRESPQNSAVPNHLSKSEARLQLDGRPVQAHGELLLPSEETLTPQNPEPRAASWGDLGPFLPLGTSAFPAALPLPSGISSQPEPYSTPPRVTLGFLTCWYVPN